MDWKALGAAIAILAVVDAGVAAFMRWQLDISQEALEGRLERMANRHNRLVDEWIKANAELRDLRTALTISEVLRKCAESPDLCGDGN